MIKNTKIWLIGAVFCLASMWFYMNHILVPYQRADAAAHQRPRGNLSDLYPRWLGARELLLHHRDPYSQDVTREIQVGYYGRELDASRVGEPKDQQAFAYPVYVVFFLAPTVGLPFEEVRSVFGWILVGLTALSVPLWLRAIGWHPPLAVVAVITLLTLGSFPAIQGFKLQQLSLAVAAMMAAGSALLVNRHLFMAGVAFAAATIKPQLALPLVLCLLLWALSDWSRRQQFVWGFGITMALLFGGATILLPGWFATFLNATREYRNYTGGLSMLDMFLTPLWGQVVTWIVIGMVAVVCWRLRREDCDAPAFGLMIALVLAVTVIVIPMFAPYNYVIALPAVLALTANWKRLWNRSPLVRATLLLAIAVIAWPWVATLGLTCASLFLSAQKVQQGWWLPPYTSAKMPIPLACLAPLSVLVLSAWRKGDTWLTARQSSAA